MKKTSTDPDAADNSRATDQPTDPADPEEIARTELRTRISECIRKTDLSTAGRLYEEGVKKWSTFILGAPNQLEIANHFFQSRSYDLAAHAYRRLLDVYHTSDPSGKLRLLLAVALVRYLDRPAEAAPYLEQAVQRLNDGPDRDLARDLLSEAQASSDQSQST